MNGKDTFPMRKLMSSMMLAVTLITIAGCGSRVDGRATAGEIDVRQLDVGQYPTRPLSEYSEFNHSFKAGRTLASMRLADNLVLGHEVDPKLTFGSFQSVDSDTPLVMSKAVHPALKPNHMLYGFATGNSDIKEFSSMSLAPGDETLADLMRSRKPTYFGLTVMQFPDAGPAERAALEIEQLDYDVAPEQNVRVPIANYPTAHSHWRPGIASMVATLAHGSYVLNVQAGVPEPEANKLTDFIQKVFDAQLPRLDKLTPLSPVEVVKMKSDPEQVLDRTLNPQKLGSPDPINFASYGLQGFLHTRRDLLGKQDLYTKVGADQFGQSWGSYTVRTRDYAAAQTLLDGIFAGDAYKPADAPAKLPAARCTENKDPQGDIKRFSCAVQYRRYVAYVQSHQLTDAHQRAAAQYAIFANSQ
ncbi:hypothetical protein ACGFQG_25610 [Nocardia fluminea]|uniref:DUF7373 family lipoprotein n=1 Tax=Nocardia fluminea TaxID=134984 RepID=UPI00371BF309